MNENVIMIIEDDDAIREITQELLETYDYGVASAANGKDALDLLERMAIIPKLILLDLMMPVMDGWEFMERKRLNAKLAQIPVIAFSALEERKISSAHTDDVIRKPVSPDVLLSVVRKYCVAN